MAPERLLMPESAGTPSDGLLGRRRLFGRHRRRRRPTPLWRQLLVLLLGAFAVMFCIQTFVARAYVVTSGSMEQTLRGCPGCTDDHVLVDKFVYAVTDPKPGDVVLFKGPRGWTDNEYHPPAPTSMSGKIVERAGALIGLVPAHERYFVKRVIATAGDTVACCDAHNRVEVNGRPLNETYLYWQPGTGSTQASFGPVTVPPDDLWLMGDNRNNSDDSRTQHGGGARGAVPVENVIGKARTVIWPLSRWQGVGDRDPLIMALGAPGWQRGLPTGHGIAMTLPTWYLARRLRDRLRPRPTRQGRR